MTVTRFQNYVFPFIQYEIGDICMFSSEKYLCGLDSYAITDIKGRNDDYVIAPKGAQIIRFAYIFKQTSSTKECQAVQNVLNKTIIQIVKRIDYNISNENSIRQVVKEWISPTICVDFEYVDEIPRMKSGKFKTVVSNLKK